jgi:hypothetical protein
MNLDFSTEDIDFRDEVGTWRADATSAGTGEAVRDQAVEYALGSTRFRLDRAPQAGPPT